MLGQQINGGTIIAAMYDRDGLEALIVVDGPRAGHRYVTARIYAHAPAATPFQWNVPPASWDQGFYTDDLREALANMAERSSLAARRARESAAG